MSKENVAHARATNKELGVDAGLVVVAGRTRIGVYATRMYAADELIFEENPWARSGLCERDWNWHLIFGYLSCDAKQRSSHYPDIQSIFERWDPVVVDRERDSQDARWLTELSTMFGISRSTLWKLYNIVCSHCMQSVESGAYQKVDESWYVECSEAGYTKIQRGMYDVLGCVQHACYPNSDCYPSEVDSGKGQLSMYATRDIRKGEEICVSYVDSQILGQQRRDYLREVFAIACSCDKCEKDTDTPTQPHIDALSRLARSVGA
ncbi:hypothetical protein CYMTET_35656 [Cymbomonas tetramitiformis]|uniref:SET domain-containing protein n=1 Tax=Cymbomonas tetramitiformis TaxID=36881 RepID=A0AAE0KNQ0_9CHLO|nr:hypothetical protein CYMTET_35656 [Cymbomonas tetramitiformis]|eukprot:gene60-85_t